MRFYRPLKTIKAMTFDLDDTLYDNNPIMGKTEDEVLHFIRQFDQRFSQFERCDLIRFRDVIITQHPEIYHDVGRWRWLSWRVMLLHYGYNADQADKGADAIMACFAKWRSDIDVPQLTHETLSTLASMIPLAAITNGNMEPQKCGLGEYFTFILKAGPDGRSKPHSDMYQLAAQRLDIACENILHIGDNLNTDVEGAIRSGMQACWINLDQRNLLQDEEARLVPHVEISRLDSLISLL